MSVLQFITDLKGNCSSLYYKLLRSDKVEEKRKKKFYGKEHYENLKKFHAEIERIVREEEESKEKETA